VISVICTLYYIIISYCLARTRNDYNNIIISIGQIARDLRCTAKSTTAISAYWPSRPLMSSCSYYSFSFSPRPPVRSFCFRRPTRVYATPSWPDVVSRSSNPLKKIKPETPKYSYNVIGT